MAVSSPAPESKENSSNEKLESEDLKNFRQEWLQELQKRNFATSMRKLDSGPAGTSTISPRQSEGSQNVAETRNLVTNVNRSKEPRNMLDHPLVRNGEIRNEDFMPHSLKKALDIYRRAVSHEQTGELDEALLLYRQAFRLDDKVDRAYHRILKLESIAKHQGDIKGDVEGRVEGRSVILQKTLNTTPSLQDNPFKIIQTFPTDLQFEPMNEDEPVLLNCLPEELIVLIISNLDPTSVERFATLCRKARLVSLDAGIWRVLVLSTYRPPQIPDHEMLLTTLESYRFDYRRVFIELPRVRLDGVYIAICHYVRPGLSENHWVNINHLITYHRYLRFFPNGQVLSLLANEEKNPQEIIPLLKPNLRMKGLFLGQWKLVGSAVHLSHLVDASTRFGIPVIEAHQSGGSHVSYDSQGLSQGPNTNSSSITHRRGHGSNSSTQTDAARYTFEMTLNLRSKPLGKWNRMDIQTYDSLNLESGDVYPVALKHERPFWFSKVRSYT